MNCTPCDWRIALVFALTGSAFPAARAATLVLTPVADAVIYESTATANGSGEFLLAGRTNQATGSSRRSLLRFDLTAVPADAEITSASLQLFLFDVTTAPTNLSLYRLTTAWTAGPSDPIGNESAGLAATIGDVTWHFASFEQSPWTHQGGDTAPAASATQSITSPSASYSWESPTLLSDLQSWLAQPDQNFGWLLRDDELTPQTAKRFASSRHPDSHHRPQLTIVFSPIPEPAPATFLAVSGVAATVLLRRRRSSVPPYARLSAKIAQPR